MLKYYFKSSGVYLFPSTVEEADFYYEATDPTCTVPSILYTAVHRGKCQRLVKVSEREENVHTFRMVVVQSGQRYLPAEVRWDGKKYIAKIDNHYYFPDESWKTKRSYLGAVRVVRLRANYGFIVVDDNFRPARIDELAKYLKWAAFKDFYSLDDYGYFIPELKLHALKKDDNTFYYAYTDAETGTIRAVSQPAGPSMVKTATIRKLIDTYYQSASGYKFDQLCERFSALYHPSLLKSFESVTGFTFVNVPASEDLPESTEDFFTFLEHRAFPNQVYLVPKCHADLLALDAPKQALDAMLNFATKNNAEYETQIQRLFKKGALQIS